MGPENDADMLSIDDEPRVPYSLRILKELKQKIDDLSKTEKVKLNEKLEQVIARELYIADFNFDEYVNGNSKK